MSDDLEQGSDGTLVAEFRLAEKMHKENIQNNNYKAITCASLNRNHFHQCADLAGAATISTDQNSLWSTVASNLYYGVLSGYLDPSDASPFGVDCSGDTLGDGVVNSFDIAVFIFAMFERPPYDVPLDTLTVDIRSDMDSECSGSESRADWQTTIGASYCPAGRRSLQQQQQLSVAETRHGRHLSTLYFDDAVDGVKLELHLELDHGDWYRISIEGVQQVLELQLGNVWSDLPIGLVNDEYPHGDADVPANQPMDADRIEIRWARRFEFLEDSGVYDCQNIVNGVSGSVALIGDTLSIRQEGSNRRALCAFDVFVYKPSSMTSARVSDDGAHANQQNLQVLRGSTWRNVQSVGVLTAHVSTDSVHPALPPPSLPPNPISPPPHPVSPPLPPSPISPPPHPVSPRRSDSRLLYATAIAVPLALGLSAAITCYFCLWTAGGRKRDDFDENDAVGAVVVARASAAKVDTRAPELGLYLRL